MPIDRSERITLIRPPKGWLALDLKEFWSYRDLAWMLISREVKVRYKQTVLGPIWALIQPVATMIVFSFIFGNLAKLPSEGAPYPIFTFTAILPWTLFSKGMSGASECIVKNLGLVKKVYFPRLILPLVGAMSGLIDFLLSLLVLAVMMIIFKVSPTVNIVWLPLFTLLALVTAWGVGLWLSVLNAQFRDIRFLTSYLTTFWMYASPVAYSGTLIPAKAQVLYQLNPMATVIDGFRWSLLGLGQAPGQLALASAGLSAVLLVGGAFYFKRMEKVIADVG